MRRIPKLTRVRTLCRLELLRLAGATDTSSKTAEWDDLLVVGNVTKVSVGLGQLETYDQPAKSSLQYSTSA